MADWASVPADPPEGERIRMERERIRSEMDARGARITAAMTTAHAMGWHAYVTGPGPEVTFSSWDQSTAVVGVEAIEAFATSLGVES